MSEFLRLFQNTYHERSNFAGRDMQREVLKDCHARPRGVLEANVLDVNDTVSLAGPFAALFERVDLGGSVDEGEQLCSGGPSSLERHRIGSDDRDVQGGDDDREKHPINSSASSSC